MRALLESTGVPFTVATYPPHTTVFLQGDPCDNVMYIEEGRVRLAVSTPQGKEGVCGLLGPGAFLGDETLVGRTIRRHTAVAIDATAVLVFTKEQITGLVHTQPGVSDRFIAHLLERHAHLEADLADQILNSAEQRLARAILMLAACDERCRCRCKLPHMSQEVIAEMVGTTRSRVNIYMSQFRKLGFIKERDGVLLVNPSVLHASRG